MSDQLDLANTPGVEYAPDIFVASAVEASKPMFEMLNLQQKGEMTEFLKTTNGIVLLAALGTLMSFLAHKKEAQLDANMKLAGR